MTGQFKAEYELKTRSGNSVWTLISTPVGMKKWLADDVTTDGHSMTFTWGDPLREHEMRTATIIEQAKNSHIRLRWEDEDEDCYWEIKMFLSELVGNYHLVITDFAEEDEVNDLRQIWDKNIKRLQYVTGI
ncbi:MAG: hypothetical protein K6A82_01740 [Prevotella sp.]|nr:hypothetical protein [Prevotella sp.]